MDVRPQVEASVRSLSIAHRDLGSIDAHDIYRAGYRYFRGLFVDAIGHEHRVTAGERGW